MSDNVAHALSGAGGGIISMVLTYPLVTISSRLQVQKNSENSEAYKNAQDAFLKIYRNEGMAGLYSGLNSAVFGIAVTNGVYYYFYEWTKAAFERSQKTKRAINTIESMIAGAIAGAATVLITNPIWVVNTRMTTRKDSLDDGEYASSDVKRRSRGRPGTIATILRILREDNVGAFWQGVMPALVLVINPIIQYSVFEQLKARLEKVRKLGNFDFFLLGAISKLIATGLTYPYTVIKSRMQLRQSAESAYKSTLDGLRKVYLHEGVAGWYKGIGSKLVQSVLTAAFLFMSKEVLFKYSVALLTKIGARKRVTA